MYNIVFTSHGEKDIKTVPKDIQKRIIKKLSFFASQEKQYISNVSHIEEKFTF
jgi:mRNA-degrading endonuclease RelE of RelBE toxin-antitoxin system